MLANALRVRAARSPDMRKENEERTGKPVESFCRPNSDQIPTGQLQAP
jgi:hypothetical protein